MRIIENNLVIPANTVLQDPIYLDKSIASIVAEEGSSLIIIQDKAGKNKQVSITLKKDSKVINKFLGKDFSNSSNSNIAMKVMLVGENASYIARGVFSLSGLQDFKYKLDIEHVSPNCTSNILFKGIVDDRAVGDFSCRVKVHPGAYKSNTQVTNKNLLLSESAIINTEPGFEIYADDVVCTHGATVGQLDQDALFYLRCRGIPEDQATKLLITAFMAEITEIYDY